MEAIKNFLNKEPVKRAARTFVQAFAGVIATTIAGGVALNKAAIFSLIGSAIAAGISAVMNLEKKDPEEPESGEE